METENAQQKINPEGNLNQDAPPSNPILNQKGNFLFIIGIVVLLFVIGTGGYLLYQKQVKPAIAPQPISQTTPSPTSTDETANWTTYRNEQYNFEFKHPQNWEEKYGLCCFSIISYEELPNNFDPTQEAVGVINSKKEFLEQKNLVDNGHLPPNFAEESRFIKAFKVGDVSAVQRFTLGLSGGVYAIKTTLFTDKVRIDILQVLPVKTLDKPLGGHPDVPQMDAEKSLKRLDEIKSGTFNKEIEAIANEHNTVLSTFKFQ